MAHSTFFRIDPPAGVTAEQFETLANCYELARPYCRGKHVLELGPGTEVGQRLAAEAGWMIAGRRDEPGLALAQDCFGRFPNVEVRLVDWCRLGCSPDSVDTIVLSQALDEISAPELFVKEAFRVLKPGGHLLVCTVNTHWQGFESAPPRRALSAEHLAKLFVHGGFYPRLFGVLPEDSNPLLRRTATSVRKLAWKLSSAPAHAGTDLRHVQLAQSLGQQPVAAAAPAFVELSGEPSERQFKVLYAVAAVDKWPPLGVPL